MIRDHIFIPLSCGINSVEAVPSNHTLNMISIAIRTVATCSEYLLEYSTDIDGEPASGEEPKHGDGIHNSQKTKQNIMMEYKSHHS